MGLQFFAVEQKICGIKRRYSLSMALNGLLLTKHCGSEER